MKQLTISIVVDGYQKLNLNLNLSNVVGRPAFKGKGPTGSDLDIEELTPNLRTENIVDSLVDTVTEAMDDAQFEADWKPE